MLFIDHLQTPGSHPLLLTSSTGQIEAELLVPNTINAQYIALLGHPHSLQGGTMQNKVVTTLARMFRDLGIVSLRFNFRGVGQSTGQYDAGRGESDDMLWLMHQCSAAKPQSQFFFAGFSFGSYVAYRAAAQADAKLLVTVAPSVEHFDYQAFSPSPKPWVVVQGEHDEVVPAEQVFAFAKRQQLPLLRFADTGHFFHGQLIALKERLQQQICQLVDLKEARQNNVDV